MAEEYKNTVPEYETPKVAAEESSATAGEVKDRGVFDFLGKKKEEEVKPQETTTLASEFEHKTKISEPTSADEEALENKHTLLEELHEKTEVDEENKPSIIEKLHRSNSSSSSSSDEEDEEKKKKKKEKNIVEGEGEKKGVMEKIKEKLPGHDEKPVDHHAPVVSNLPVSDSTEHYQPEEEKKGAMDKIKEKLPGHTKTPEESPLTVPLVISEDQVDHSTEHTGENPTEKKGIIEKIKEKLPGYHAKTSGEEVKKESE